MMAHDEADQRRAALLEQRAAMLRRVTVADDEQDALFWVAAFSVSGERYAFPLASIHAAVPLRLVTPIPLAPAGVVGVLAFQGEILTVLSLFTLLGATGWRQDPSILLVVDAGNRRRVAVDCAEIPRGMTVPLRAVQQATPSRQGIREITLRGGEQLSLLDVDLLLDAGEDQGRGR